MKSYKKHKTSIEGVSLLFNKVVQDDRGYFLDLAETDNPIIKNTQHLHCVLATEYNKSRGEHYHYRLHESFHTVSGTSLCCLHDFNTESSSYGTTFAFISGNKPTNGSLEKISRKNKIKCFFLEDSALAQIIVPPLVWPSWWKLTDDTAVIVATGDGGYDPEDYAKPEASAIEGVVTILNYYGITI